MKTTKFTKNYVGKGKRLNNFSVKFTISMEMIEKYKWEKDGKFFFSFETSEMKQADQWGKTHTAYVTSMEYVEKEVEETTTANEGEINFPPDKPAKKRRSRKITA